MCNDAALYRDSFSPNLPSVMGSHLSEYSGKCFSVGRPYSLTYAQPSFFLVFLRHQSLQLSNAHQGHTPTNKMTSNIMTLRTQIMGKLGSSA
jgi:hypothetical protein